ncbi:transcription antitermination factor NusB [Desulfovermiculus halophilus]|jgi:N utilization substance protein B|uniref:transcription antitermination factor NusB n=1 Tax=Desulfovermiculus halophilus TaxID=339722 RepID=UPI000482FB1D|nr:transcription antitermination factor NusB [Desulfovermiculus halophilus]
MAKKHKSPRRQGREKAFQVLYGMQFYPQPDLGHMLRTFDHFIGNHEEDLGTGDGFALELVRGVLSNLPRLDALITAHCKNWRLERIGKIELTVLRLSLFELLHREDVPDKVAINEGIELAKKFGDNRSGGFVNGILDAIVHAREQSA